MKIQYYVLYNGRNGFLLSNSRYSWTIVIDSRNAQMFADLEEVENYMENKLNFSWKEAFIKGTFCIANVIDEL